MSEILKKTEHYPCCSEDGFNTGSDLIFRCKHCGDTFLQERFMDAAGSGDTRLVRLTGEAASYD